jgi:RNA polymerase sigma-70 factor (ECF subfamily)
MAQPDRSEQKLVQKAVGGNRKAFKELFERYFQAVYNYALTLSHDPALAEDLTQEAFIRAHKNLHRLGPPWNFHAWIFRMTRNYFIDLVRKDRDLYQLEEEKQVISPGPGPEREAISQDAAEKVHSTLNRLPDKQREILVLRELQGFSYADIEGIMEISSSNVKVTLHRAREAFRESYGIQLLLEDPSGDCLETADLLNVLHDGEDLLDREHFVKEHLKVCAACQKRRDLLVKQSALLGAFIPAVPPPDLAPRILEQIGVQPGAQSSPKGSRIQRILGYGGTAGLLALTVYLSIRMVTSPEQILPNFPGLNDPIPTQTISDLSPLVGPGQPTSTPRSMNSQSGPVPPAPRCGLFPDDSISVVLLNVREDSMTLPLYFEMEAGVPGLSLEVPEDDLAWEYRAALGEYQTSSCSLQGFDDRLYCLFTIEESILGTYQPVELFLPGCEGPVYSLAAVSIPEFPEDPEPPEPAGCHAGLEAKMCVEQGGDYRKVNDTTYLCFCP